MVGKGLKEGVVGAEERRDRRCGDAAEAAAATSHATARLGLASGPHAGTEEGIGGGESKEVATVLRWRGSVARRRLRRVLPAAPAARGCGWEGEDGECVCV